MRILYYLCYIIFGVFNLFAVYGAISCLTNWTIFVKLGATILTTYIPLLGTGLGIYGAMLAWEWPLIKAVGIMAGIPLLLIILISRSTPEDDDY